MGELKKCKHCNEANIMPKQSGKIFSTTKWVICCNCGKKVEDKDMDKALEKWNDRIWWGK